MQHSSTSFQDRAAAQKPIRICLVVSSEMTVTAFLLQPLAALAQRYALHLVVNTPNPASLIRGIQAEVISVPIERAISPWRDFVALFRLWRLFRQERFHLVHSITPKAGLLAMLAACLAGVPKRVHTFTGQVWVTRRGWKRMLLKTLDRVLAVCATNLLADSPSQRQFLIREGVVGGERITVLGQGSLSGVDENRFRPDPAVRSEIRRQCALPEEAVVFLFLGRLNQDKGVPDLARAFVQVAQRVPEAYLLVVGPDEANLAQELDKIGAECGARIRRIGHTDQPEHYMAAADVFCLPSYREGFGSVIIEAAATGLPAIGSRIYGVTDAIREGETGKLFTPGSLSELAALMEQLARDSSLRRTMGAQARMRAVQEFSSARMVQAWLTYYHELLHEKSP